MEDKEINKLFRETQDKYQVSSKELADTVGITTKHLSQFRNGHTNIPTNLLWQLLEEMNRQSPGAKNYFAEKLAGQSKPLRVEVDLEKTINELEAQDLLRIWDLANQRVLGLYKDIYKSRVKEERQSQPLAS